MSQPVDDNVRALDKRARTVHVINGPNLDLLGRRELAIYGTQALSQIERSCGLEADIGNLCLVFRQSNAEHEIIGWIHEARASAGIVINPAAFSYSSYAIFDALKACDCPIIEVHLSNIHARAEPWRGQSLISPAVNGVISGLGADGYCAAIRHVAALFRNREPQKRARDGEAEF